MSIARTNPEQTQTGRREIVSSQELPVKSIGTMVLPNRVLAKADVPDVAKRVVDTLGEFVGAMERFVFLKQAGEIIKSACEQSLDHAYLKMSGKEMDCMGAIVKTRGLVEYEYDDPVLRAMESEAEVLKAKIDQRKKFLRTLDKPMADTETGEIVNPAKKTRDGQTLVVTFK